MSTHTDRHLRPAISGRRTGWQRWASARPRPRAIQVSYWLYLFAAASGLIVGLVLDIFNRPGVTPVTQAASGLILAVIFLFGALCALKMAQGVHWARVALTVLTVLAAISAIGILSFLTPARLNWFGATACVVGCVLLWTPNARAWFRLYSGQTRSSDSTQ